MIPVLLGAVFLLVAGVFFTLHLMRGAHERERGRARDMLRALAPRLSVPDRLLGESLHFVRRGFPAAVSVHVGTRLNVEVSFKLTGEDDGWLTVTSLGLRRALLDQFGLKDLQIGDAEFDSRFEVWGLDAQHVRDRLQPTLRGMLLQADRRWDFLLRLAPQHLSLRARVDPLDRYQVETLVGLAYQILDLLDPKAPGEFVIATVQERLTEETRCPVCGAPLSRGSVVRCGKCRAAHHSDCWQFNGLCATFACGSRSHAR
jgi:hypothetical protein